MAQQQLTPPLAHNTIPLLIEAVALLEDLNGYAENNPSELYKDHPLVQNVRKFLGKLEVNAPTTPTRHVVECTLRIKP